MRFAALLLILLSLVGSAAPLAEIPLPADLSLTNGETRAFEFTGQILARNPGMIILQDTHRAAALRGEDTVTRDCRDGDLVRVRGRIFSAGPIFRHNFRMSEIEIIGHRPLPTPIEVSGGDIANGTHLYRFVTISGVIASARRSPFDNTWNWLIIRTPTGSAGISARESAYPIAELRKLVDADVTVSGIVVRSWGSPDNLGAHISLRGNRSIVVQYPAGDPFAGPPLFSCDALHRQHVSGRVLAVGENRFYLAADSGRRFPVLLADSTKLPAVGNRVTVAGFTETDPINLRLFGATFRVESDEPRIDDRPEPLTIGPESLTSPPRHCALVKLVATVGKPQGTDNVRSGILPLDVGGRAVSADVSAVLADADRPEPDSIIEITGIYALEFENASAAEAFPRLRQLTITPRGPSDIRIISTPSWWTPHRLLLVIVLLGALLLSILVWNRALVTLSERRGRQLYRETLARTLAELKTEERTRLAVELHDSLSQTLTGVALQIDAASGTLTDAPTTARRFLETARAMLASCRQELRCCIWDLRNRTFEEHDMTEAVTKVLAPHLGDVSLQVRFNVPRNILSESTVHDTLRIIRELALNAIRHGHARQLRIAGEYRDGLLRFSVKDDGIGFDPDRAEGPAQGHFGLQGIRERLNARNGTLSIDSAPGQGTKVTIYFNSEDGEDNDR